MKKLKRNKPQRKASTVLFSRFGKLFFLAFMMMIIGFVGMLGVISYYSKDLPSTEDLKNYHPKVMTRLYDARGNILAEYAREKRVFVPIDKIPPVVKQAFIAAEDQNFYKHPGIDVVSIFRAMVGNVKTKVTGSGSISGGSTITQQVVKNLVLSNERSLERKIKEAILAIRISKSLPKDKILEIYLNEIYLGNRSYGVGAASLSYFNKPVGELSAEEAALLAAMPKAPSRFDPWKNEKRAHSRRNWVIGRMADEGFIDKGDAREAKKRDIILQRPDERETVTTHFAEEIRRKLIGQMGEEEVYGGGLLVRTALDPVLQRAAEKALFEGIMDYDRAHGWRGPLAHINDITTGWQKKLIDMKEPEGLGPWEMVVVLEIGADAKIGFKNGNTTSLGFDTMKWAKKNLSKQRVGAAPRKVSDVVSVGDVIAVSEKIVGEEGAQRKKYSLEQIPNVNGAIVAMDPQTGRVLAMVGGYTYGDSQFNRATQAKRQPGSAFKPFVYLAALENGFTPSTLIEDGPIEIEQGPGLPKWIPKNYAGDFLGYVSLRKGLEKSRNNMTVLLALMMGVEKVQEVAKRLNILDDPNPYYSMVLGAQETTLIRLTSAYAAIVNGGKRVEPKMIDSVQDSNGKTIYKTDKRKCSGCNVSDKNQIPTIRDDREQVIDPIVSFQLTSMLQGVVQRGTATRANKIGKPLAGKTGTTNDNYDTWFMGFSPDLVVGTYIGFDRPRSLGPRATGSSVALPVWINFMQTALKDVPAKPFKAPSGLSYEKVDITTGFPPSDYSRPQDVVYEVINPYVNEIEYSQDYQEYETEKQEAVELFNDYGSYNTGIY